MFRLGLGLCPITRNDLASIRGDGRWAPAVLSLSNPGARPQPTERANAGQPKVRARSYGVQRTSAADVIRPVTNVLAVLFGVGKDYLYPYVGGSTIKPV